jgi:hypothetical protein
VLKKKSRAAYKVMGLSSLAYGNELTCLVISKSEEPNTTAEHLEATDGKLMRPNRGTDESTIRAEAELFLFLLPCLLYFNKPH